MKTLGNLDSLVYLAPASIFLLYKLTSAASQLKNTHGGLDSPIVNLLGRKTGDEKSRDTLPLRISTLDEARIRGLNLEYEG
jgi:hypothetical protein